VCPTLSWIRSDTLVVAPTRRRHSERSGGDCALELSCVESLRFNSWAMNTTASEGQSRYREACLDPRPYYEAPSITDQIVRTAKLAALTL
jgi:hypothetical protein